MITEFLINSTISLRLVLLLFFPLQLVSIQFIFLFTQPKKEKFWGRVALMSFATIIFMLFVPQLVTGEWIAFVYFSIMFILSLFVMGFCFKADIKVLLFCCAAGYCSQNIAVNVISTVSLVVYQTLILSEAAGIVLSILTPLIVFPSVYFLIYRIFIRRFKGAMFVKLSVKHAVVFAVLTIFTAIFINCFLVGPKLELLINSIASRFTIILCNGLLVYVQFGLLMQDSLVKEIREIQRMWQQDHEFYEKSKENIKVLNIRLHDLKHIFVSREEQFPEDVRNDVVNAIKEYDAVVCSGNEALDVVLTDKNVNCMGRGIELSIVADGEKLNFMNSSDIYSLFGNILDNAIESVMRIEDKSKRIISLSVMGTKEGLVIREQNYFEDELLFDNGLPITTKEDKEHHGYGVKSIGLLAKKYGGEFSIEVNGKIFTVNLLFPL